MKPGKVVIHMEWSVDLDNSEMVEAAKDSLQDSLTNTYIEDIVEIEESPKVTETSIKDNYFYLGLGADGTKESYENDWDAYLLAMGYEGNTQAPTDSIKVKMIE
jgi:hypothetical protein